MKLSDAILLGSTLNKQTFGSFMDEYGTCAMGAAYRAVGVANPQECTEEEFQNICYQYWNWVDDDPFVQLVRCPASKRSMLGIFGAEHQCVYTDDVVQIIYHLNDMHQWTREQIAEWVSTIEPKEAVNVTRSGSNAETQETTTHDGITRASTEFDSTPIDVSGHTENFDCVGK